MKIFKFHKGARKKINWMTVKCDVCKSYYDNPYVMFVDREEIKVRPVGYKGFTQIYTRCTKCGKTVVISKKDIPRHILDYVLKKHKVKQ